MLRSDHSAFLTGLPLARLTKLSLLVAAALLALGCTPKIGDSCSVSTNCSSAGDRLCDITEPGGYCTVFNCEPGSCPEDSVCINFGTTLSPVSGCSSSQGTSPYQRSFCMASCGSDGDCRGGYTCQDLRLPNPLGAVLAESSGSGKVCAVPAKNPKDLVMLETYDGGTSNQVCLGSDAGAVVGQAGASAAGGSSGSSAGGESGASGESGDGGAGG